MGKIILLFGLYKTACKLSSTVKANNPQGCIFKSNNAIYVQCNNDYMI